MGSKTFKFGSFVMLMILGLDQLIKYLVIYVFEINYILNKGVAFGIFDQMNFGFVITINFLVLLCMGYWVVKSHEYFGFWMILGGGVSNFIDRILYGGVVDFVSIFDLPLFNLADACINVGLIFIVFKLWLDYNNQKNQAVN